MPRGSKLYTPLTLGFLTETTPLGYPDGATSDELNTVITDKKSRRPRFGHKEEDGHVYTNIGQLPDVTSNHYWDNPDNLKRTRFLVLQIRNRVRFWDISEYNSSANLKSFSINLNDYTNPYFGSASGDPIDVASGKGFLFICSPRIEPLLVEYDSGTDDITVTQLTIKIRDFKFLPMSESFEDRPVNPSNEFLYNLRNQGWTSGRLDDYINGGGPYLQQFSGYGRYPSLTKHWGLGLRPYVSSQSSPSGGELARIGRDYFDPQMYNDFKWTGSSLAPNGRFVYDAFNITREVDGVPVQQEIKKRRPISVCFKFGRVWWTDGDLIYFSQIIEQDPLKAQFCYQEADPTSNDVSDVVDTDGGVINLLEASFVIKIMSASNSVVVFCENGVWDIAGQEGDQFKPSAYVPRKVSDSELLSIKTASDIEGIPIWVATDGIYTMGQNEITRSYEEQSLTEETIATWFDDNMATETDIDICYDRTSRKVYFQYGNNFLVYDTVTRTFHPWTLGTSTKTIHGVFSTKDRGTASTVDTVTVNGEIVTADGENVTVDVVIDSTSTITLKTIIFNATSVTFGGFIDEGFYDWDNVPYTVFMESGYMFEQAPVNRKSIPYITCWFKEDGINSECNLYHKWDFSTDTTSNLEVGPIDVYQTRGPYRNTTMTTNQLHGSGNFVVLRWEGVAGKDFDFYGFNIDWDIDNATNFR